MSVRRLVIVFVALTSAVGCGVLLGFDDVSFGTTSTNGDGGGLGDGGGSDALTDGNTPTSDTSTPPSLEDGAACPSGGRGRPLVPAGTFCIDSYEVTSSDYAEFLDAGGPVIKTDPRCNLKTSARTGAANGPKYPITDVDWCDAFSYCAWAGKRLCGRVGGGSLFLGHNPLDSQWYRACSMNGQRDFPYGDMFDRSKCVMSPAAPLPELQSPTAGPNTSCLGGYGQLYDMSGNVGEWEDSCNAKVEEAACAVRGGAFFETEPEQVTCSGQGVTYTSTFHIGSIGFRCCAP